MTSFPHHPPSALAVAELPTTQASLDPVEVPTILMPLAVTLATMATLDMTPYPGMYQRVNPREQKHKHNFAPFNSLLPQFRTYSKDSCYPGPTTYNPEIKPPKKVTWPMKFGSPDWAQVPCLQKRTLRAELPTDKDFRKPQNRVAYLSLYYN
ncbi:ciliary microtubule-associated protein 3 [Mesoplodon densirostris]|uniref:ciliary microtubule-associated protein 3 n=1 Tax=Mesoplodon densirostris TaxID=48708 RepID=UPI0028DBE422|nr:ciliary microtubule-associated protein 3 [Mesoplodon densirostris]